MQRQKARVGGIDQKYLNNGCWKTTDCICVQYCAFILNNPVKLENISYGKMNSTSESHPCVYEIVSEKKA